MLILVAVSHIALANDTDRLEQANACAEMDSRLDRLKCYDGIFKTSTPQAAASRSSLWHAVEPLEEARSSDDFGFLVRENDDEVFMSVPAKGTSPPRPLLVLSCQDTITRFQLLMREPIDGARKSLGLDTGQQQIEQTWQVRDDGHVLSGGRGLPAIDTLRGLLDIDRLTLNSQMPLLDGLRFDFSGLREAIKPLREACHW